MPGKLYKEELNIKKRDKRRYIIIIVAAVLVFVLLFLRTFEIQIANSEKYVEQANGIARITAPIKASRGEILDCYGRPIATNREGYNIIFNYASISKTTINDTILSLIKLLGEHKWKDDLPLLKTAPYSFDKEAPEISKKRMLDMLELAHYATANNCFDALVKRYSLEDRDKNQQRLIMGVRYTMERAGFSISVPFTFAEDVNSRIMTIISENTKVYGENGVSIEVASFREYDNASVAPHIIGTVSPIYAEDWEELKAKGYSYDDKVGRSGIEKACEDELRGTDGEITYKVDSKGKILSSEVTKEPIPGHTVRLTIDKNVQVSAQNALMETIKQLNKDKIFANAGAAVAVNVKTGGVLAAVNCPTYTYEQYENNYESLVKDTKGRPLFDRAFTGAYPPGSTFKPAVACAALQEGVITSTETITCVRKYRYFKDYQPNCMHFHGGITLIPALSKSCNYFFFETGRRLGITKMNSYCKKLGLGVKTGVEVSESAGTLAGPESRAEWYEGYTLSAAIGQSDNAFTPLQLATYTATIANSGVRYKTTLIDKIMSYSQDKVIKQSKPEIIDTVKLDENVINQVKKGMLSVTEDGTGSRVFADYPITVGGKTGTAETAKGADHTVFIAFAPYENPEIAVAVIIEHGKYSSYSGGLLKAIFNAYFFTELQNETDEPAYELLP